MRPVLIIADDKGQADKHAERLGYARGTYVYASSPEKFLGLPRDTTTIIAVGSLWCQASWDIINQITEQGFVVTFR